MEKSLFFEKLKSQAEKKYPFVAFALPNTSKVVCLFQKNARISQSEDFTKQGFVFSPFKKEHPHYFISNENAEIFSTEFIELKEPLTEYTLTHTAQEANHHIDLVNNAIEKLQDSKLQKVVVSRKKEVAITDFNLEKLVTALFSHTTTSFRYLWFHPETDFWCGSTPETLVSLKDNEFQTMALAGTKKLENGLAPQWTSKEYYEQQIVTDAIYDVLNNLTPVLKISKPYNHKSGNIYHIRTDVKGVMRNSNAKLSKILKVLHPTPAVCGMPTKLAKKYIEAVETHCRAFYTGFLGPINSPENGSCLYVNLRCMQLTPQKATIYAGGGIVPESIAEKEWEETCLKMQPMANLIGAMF